MSIRVMTMVWDGFPGSGTELLAMLALADWCDDSGGSLYPSIKAVAEKIRVGEKHARNILRALEQDRYLAVVANHAGGMPGTTRHYRINLQKLKLLADAAIAKREAEKAEKAAKNRGVDEVADIDWSEAVNTPPPQVTPSPRVTPPLQVTPPPQMGGTAPLQVTEGSPAVPMTPPLQGSLTVIEPSIEPPVIPAAPAAQPTATGAAPAGKQKKVKADDAQDTELQAACRATWGAYAAAYTQRYGVAPVRNAPVNTQVKQLVQRLGGEEAPCVAAFFVASVTDAYVMRQCHPIGALLHEAESYRTRWATNRTAAPAPTAPVNKFQSAAHAIFDGATHV